MDALRKPPLPPLRMPERLEPVFARYRGTGKFTMGDVSEFVKRWNTVQHAKSMDLLQWLNHAVLKTERAGLINCDRRDYIDQNLDLWVDMWRYADGDETYFSRGHARSFLEEGLITMVRPDAYNYSDHAEDGAKDDWVFDLVKFNTP